MRIRVLLSVLGLGLLVLACLAAARSDLAAADRLGRALSAVVIGAAVPLAPLLVERLRRPPAARRRAGLRLQEVGEGGEQPVDVLLVVVGREADAQAARVAEPEVA